SDAPGAAMAAPVAKRRQGRWRRALTTFVPTRRLVIVVTLFAPVWLASSSDVGARIALIITALIVAAVVLDALTAPAHWQVEIERTVPDRLGLGDTVDAAYVVTLAAGRSLRFALYDDLPRGVRANTGHAESRHTV